MGLNYQKLIDAVRGYCEKYGRGAKAYLAEQSGLDPNIITKIDNGKTTRPSVETWDLLHDAFPEEIPPPEFDRVYGLPGSNGKKKPPEIRCPLFGVNNSCSELIHSGLNVAPDNKTCFTVFIQDNAMSPRYNPGDIAIVDAKARAKNGQLVFVKNIEGKGSFSSLRWYHVYGDTVVLRADNTAEYLDIVFNAADKHEIQPVGYVICSMK